jgi:hypothetical protein
MLSGSTTPMASPQKQQQQKQQQPRAPFLLNDRKSYQFYDSYFSFFSLDSFNGDPARLISDNSLSLYEDNVRVGSNGGLQPSQRNIRIYEEHVKQKAFMNTA